MPGHGQSLDLFDSKTLVSILDQSAKDELLPRQCRHHPATPRCFSAHAPGGNQRISHAQCVSYELRVSSWMLQVVAQRTAAFRFLFTQTQKFRNPFQSRGRFGTIFYHQKSRTATSTRPLGTGEGIGRACSCAECGGQVSGAVAINVGPREND